MKLQLSERFGWAVVTGWTWPQIWLAYRHVIDEGRALAAGRESKGGRRVSEADYLRERGLI